MRRYNPGLWSNADFVKLWLGQTVSNFGSGITGIALPLTAVLVLAATPTQMGILGALDGVAVLVIGLLAGVWVDRVRRRPLLIAADLGRAFVLGTIPLAALLGVLGIGQLYVVAALAGMLTVLFNVAHSAFLPSLIPRESLVEANSKLAMSDSLAEIGGPAVAGPLVQLISAPFALFFDALSFLFSACCLGLIHTPEPPPIAIEQRKSIWSDLVEGLRLVLKNPLLRALAGSAGTFSLFGNFIGALYVLYVIRQVGAPPIFLGFLVATGGVSALVGALLAERVVRRFGPGMTVGMGLFMYGATGLLIPLAGGSVALALSLRFLSQLIGDASVSIYLIAEVSLRQSLVPANVLGRTNASMQFLSQGIAPLGALLAGILGGMIGLRLTILIGVLGVMLAGTWLLLSPVRKV
ncbi:MAG: MFS transporter [Chloroflexi bacterium]|nr:MAG: MFS transporter [Chloroflexota bacterium]